MQSTHLLLIDDQKDAAFAFQILLERRGFLVTVASSVDEGLKAARLTEFDIVVCDICFPHDSGYIFLESFRKHSQRPVIAISSRARIEDQEEAEKRGFVKLVAKPFLIDTLTKVIDQVLASNKSSNRASSTRS